jgi:hypothetical protein
MIAPKQVSGVILADGSVPFTGNQSFGGFRATNMADPVSSDQGATKNFADQKTLAFGQWQQLQAANSATNRFVLPGGGNNSNATEALSVIIAPAAGFLTGMYVFFGVAMTTCTTTFTVRVNGVNSSIVVALARSSDDRKHRRPERRGRCR